MIPIVTPAEMGEIDAAAPEPVDVLIARAGSAVARHAIALLGGTYGRRIVVIAGPGNNGNDGRVAAARLQRAGASVAVFAVADAPRELPACDLVIDAAFGTGLRRPYAAPRVPGGAAVLAVDIASGIDGSTGLRLGEPVMADATLTFAALKPGLVLQPGRAHCGEVTVADIGLDVSRARAHVVEAADLDWHLTPVATDAHKWQRACWVIGGSPGMTGAPQLAAAAAARAGAGYVRLSVPGGVTAPLTPIEAVQVPVGADLEIAGDELARVCAVVIGPGLGRSAATTAAVRRFVATAPVALVVDGDALTALGADAAALARGRSWPTVLTPHDGEFRALTGAAPGDDRFAACRALARDSGAVVLLKGPTTIVARPDGAALVSIAGDSRLATAGTGDVLSGVIGGLLAHGVEPFAAAGLAAFVHGSAAVATPHRFGMVASDLVDAVATVLSRSRGVLS